MWPGWSWVNLLSPAIHLLMGIRASYLQIYQAPGSNALETAKGVYAELAKLKQTFPADVEYSVPFESVTVVKVSMQDVVGTLLKTLGLVALVVFLFLQNWRSTLIPVLAIPVSIFGTFCFFIPLGFYHQYTDHVWFCTGYRYCGG